MNSTIFKSKNKYDKMNKKYEKQINKLPLFIPTYSDDCIDYRVVFKRGCKFDYQLPKEELNYKKKYIKENFCMINLKKLVEKLRELNMPEEEIEKMIQEGNKSTKAKKPKKLKKEKDSSEETDERPELSNGFYCDCCGITIDFSTSHPQECSCCVCYQYDMDGSGKTYCYKCATKLDFRKCENCGDFICKKCYKKGLICD